MLGVNITKAVISVPAYFNNAQRQATRDAGRLGGLDVQSIITEPTAAGLAYGLTDLATIGAQSVDKSVVVFDFGGGTLDVTLLKITGKDFSVVATDGDSHLGGQDVDQNIMRHFIDKFKKEYVPQTECIVQQFVLPAMLVVRNMLCDVHCQPWQGPPSGFTCASEASQRG